MSAVGQLFLSMQERPEFTQGLDAYTAGVARADNPHRIGGHGFLAWQMGWDHERDDEQPRCEP